MFVQEFPAMQELLTLNEGGGYTAGEVGQQVMSMGFEKSLSRPYYAPTRNGRFIEAIDVRTGRMVTNKQGKLVPEFRPTLLANARQRGIPVVNAPTSLRKLEWEELDRVVLRAARERLRAWSDLAGANSFGGFDGMAKLILEHETMSDPGEAFSDFDGLTEGRNDAPQFQLQGLPLPISHADFFVSSRRLAVSRNSGTPIDTTMGEACARRVAERIEKTTIGTITGDTYGLNSNGPSYGRTPTVYGYTNFPARLTGSALTKPTTGGWLPATTISQVLGMINTLANQRFYGPFMLYHSTDWDQYLDNDYFLSATTQVSTQTLRNRLRSIEQVMDVRRLDFLTSATNPFTFLLVQMTPDVARAVNGMDITTVQWPSMGGMRLNFKVMAIQVPQLRADFYNCCGILQAVAS